MKPPTVLLYCKANLVLRSAAILNNYLTANLSSVLTPEQLQSITESLSAINELTPNQQIAVKKAFSEGYHKQNIYLTALSAVGFIVSLFLWEKNPRRVA